MLYQLRFDTQAAFNVSNLNMKLFSEIPRGGNRFPRETQPRVERRKNEYRFLERHSKV